MLIFPAMFARPLCLLLSLLSAITATATVALPDLFAAHMVFQREQPLRVWGTAAAGESVTVQLLTTAQAVQAAGSTVAGADGKWSVTLAPQPASTVGSPLSLRVAGTNEIVLAPVQIGDVWLCSGQSNLNFLMRPYSPFSEGVLDWENEVAAGTDAGMAVFTVTPESNDVPLSAIHGAWRPTTPTYTAFTSAVPYYFGKTLRRELGIPVGIIVSALGGTAIKSWTDYATLQGIPAAASFLSLHATRRTQYAAAISTYKNTAVAPYRELALQKLWTPTYATAIPDPEGYPTWRYQPAGLYNAMIAPLADFPVRGFVWYQGEGDSTDHANYAHYLSAMIAGWRASRGDPTLPFLLVQLANYDHVKVSGNPALHDNWAYLREQQQRVVDTVPATGLAVAADVGDTNTIHPRDKRTVSERLALVARRLAYGETALVASGPRFDRLEVDGPALTVYFRDLGGGLVLDFNRATGGGPSFQLAGPDDVFHDATPVLSGDHVTLTAPQVTAPRKVRYGFHNDPKLILYNAEGLPAAPFRAGLPTRPLAAVPFAGDTTATTDADIRTATVTRGAALTGATFPTTTGLPPPALSLATHLTPATAAEAVAAGSYVEFSVEPVHAHRLLLAGASFQFDVARSTAGAVFGYFVRWNLDNFATDLAAATIEAEAGVFTHVEVSLDRAEPALDAPLALRVYLWDEIHNSARYAYLDNLTLHATTRYEPGLTIAALATPGTMRLEWAGVPGRRYRLHKSTTLDGDFPVWASDLLCSASGRLTHDFAFVGPREFYTVSEQLQ